MPHLRLFQSLSVGWTSWETDYLFDQCQLYDLRFPIIYDRYAPLQVLTAALSSPRPPVHSAKPRKRSDSTLLAQHSASTALSTMSNDAIKALIEQVESSQPRTIEQLKDRSVVLRNIR